MAYVEWHSGIRNHYKTDALMLALGIKRREAIGMIGMLSSWAIEYRPGGIIERHLIKVAVEWEGDEEVLLKSLISSGWLDGKGSKVGIHDWAEITRGYRKARADATRRGRDASAKQALVKRDASASTAPLPPRTEQNRTERTERSGTEQKGAEEGVADAPPLAPSIQILKDALPHNGAHAPQPTHGPAEEAIRLLMHHAGRANLAANDTTVRKYLKAWVARSSPSRVEQMLMDPWTKGKTIIEIQEHFFPKESPLSGLEIALQKSKLSKGTSP